MTDALHRRTLLKAMPALALTGAATPLAATPAAALATPALTLAMRLRVLIGAPQELGMVDGVRKRVIPITGGTVDGPRLTGQILPGGADWQSIRADGTADILARYSIEASDGAIISITNPGYRHGPAPVLARIAKGEAVAPPSIISAPPPGSTWPATVPTHGWAAPSFSAPPRAIATMSRSTFSPSADTNRHN